MAKSTPPELPVILFPTSAAWTDWLAAHGAEAQGIWMRLGKKNAGLTSIDYAQAVEGALCYGWIDGVKHKHDDVSWLQKFTPRRAKSIWSKINREKAQALIDSGQMQPAGLAAVEAAQADGRWDAAYDSSSNMTVPADFQVALDANVNAQEFFATLNKTNRYAILFRIHQAKRPATRTKRINDFIAMLEKHEKLHP